MPDELKFLVAEVAETTSGIIPGEWVIPCLTGGDAFTGVASGKNCGMARVKSGFLPDACLKKLCADYPGIPSDILEFFIVETVLHLRDIPDGRRYCILSDASSARLRGADDGSTITLWTGFNSAKYLE